MANCDCSTPARAAPATLMDFDEALSQSRVICDIITKLSEASMGETVEPCPYLFVWLGNELDARLERIELARDTMAGRACA